MYDIVIIGAGPGGATLARLIDKKYKVLIVDKRNMDEKDNFIKNKCCGGLLAPDAQNMLAHLGLGLPKEVLTEPQMFSVKTIDFDNNIERYYQRNYINIDREKFDRWLVSIIPENIDTRFNFVYKKYIKKDDCIEIVLADKDKKNHIIKTKILVGADGAISKVREQAFKNKNIPKNYVSIQRWYKTEENMAHFVSIFDSKVTDFYSWIIQKEGNLIVGSAIPIFENANEKFEELIDKLKKINCIKGDFHKQEGTLIMRTRKINQINTDDKNIALIGEAAGFISPSSAEGISYAIKSGLMLAESINGNFDNYFKIYNKKIKKIKFNIFLKNLKLIFMYNKFLRKIIMKSKILSMDII